MHIRSAAADNGLKRVLITGATSGIGQAAVKLLTDKGCRVLVHGRNQSTSVNYCKELDTPLLALPVWGDLASLKEVHSLAVQVAEATPLLDVVILNAGVFQKGGLYSRDGFELDFQVNYLSHLLLAHLLIKNSCLSPRARIIFVSSSAYINGKADIDHLGKQYIDDPMMAYATSKQLCLMAALELADRLSETGLCVNACNPGPAGTKLLAEGRDYGWRNSGRPAIKAARRLEWLALSPELQKISGNYFNGKQTPNVPKRVRDKKLISSVYEKSIILCGADNSN